MFFPNEESLNSLQDLYKQIREYLALQKELTMVTLAEKLTMLLSAITLAVVIIMLMGMALLYFSFTMAYVLEPHMGGLAQSFALITAIIAVAALIIYAFRGRLIYRPITRFIAKLLISNEEDSDEK